MLLFVQLDKLEFEKDHIWDDAGLLGIPQQAQELWYNVLQDGIHYLYDYMDV